MQKDGLEWRIEMSNGSIPKDPVMLLSYVNTQLRDFYPDIEEMCKSLDIDRELCYFTIRISYIRFIFVYTKFWPFPIRL